MTTTEIKIVEILYQDGSITMTALQELLYEDLANPAWLQECQQKLREVNALMSCHHRYFGRQLEGTPITVTDE